MRPYRLCILCPVIAAVLAALAILLNPPVAQAQGNVSFMKDVAPILKENCFACHDAKKRKGKLDMTTFERLMKGGDRGEAVVAGKPEESFLWTLTSGMHVATVHLVCDDDADPTVVLTEAAGVLRDRFAIEHATIQVEPRSARACVETNW